MGVSFSSLSPFLTSFPPQAARDAQLYGQLLTEEGGPKSWYWVIGPLTLYILERLQRWWKSKWRRLQVITAFCCWLWAFANSLGAFVRRRRRFWGKIGRRVAIPFLSIVARPSCAVMKKQTSIIT